jgi:uncharacterized protein
LSFVGNRAMADLTLELVRTRPAGDAGGAASRPANTPADAVTFLSTIGFLAPDPAPPPSPSTSYHQTTAVLLLTNRCNLRCTYCYARGGEGAAQTLSLELGRAAIDQVHDNARELGQARFEVTFHGGGEPLQAWETLQALTAYARGKELPCRVSMVSNGICTAGQRSWLLHNLNSCSISFDGQQETQDRQRPFASGQGSFKAVMRTLETLDKNKFSYGIRMTATAPWQGRLAEDVRFICEETGCPAMQVEPAFNTRRGVHQGPTDEESEAFSEAFMEAFEVAARAGRQLTYSGARPWLITHSFCTAPRGALIVNPAGSLVACYEVADGDHPLAELSTLGCVAGSRVSMDQDAQNALWSYLDNKRARCRDCFCYWHCAGDCYTRAFSAARGNPEARSPRCHMNREITARILLWYIMNSDGVWRGGRMNAQAAQLMQAF